MDKSLIKNLMTNFICDFDNHIKEHLANRPIWQLDESLKSLKGTDVVELLKLQKEEKIEWLTKINQHPYRQLAIKLKNEIVNKSTENTIIKTIDEMCNGKFLDSINVPGNSTYSDLILSLCEKLNQEKNISS